jgi:two-component system LytT family sensor kinase
MDPRPLIVVLGLLVAAALIILVRRHRRELVSPADRATFETLHTASMAAPSLRQGLTHDGAKGAVKHLRVLLGAPGIAITDREVLLAWEGSISDHSARAAELAEETLTTGHPTVLGPDKVGCRDIECPNRNAITAAIVDGDTIVGALVAFCPHPSASLVRAVEEVATWVSAQVELAGAEQRETRLMQAELRALRAQISPHFVYNSLTAIASFVRTDPDRARELLLEFADFSRYALRRGGEYTTLADEIRNVERYLELEQARFGERLKVSLRVAPEVLSVRLPYLVIQPLVENAVRHGLEAGNGTVAIVVSDAGSEAEISVEDNGVGSEPDVIRRALAGDSDVDSVGLGNVDGRLRQVYGDSYGLVVETAPGAGTKASFRIPKFAPGVHLP